MPTDPTSGLTDDELISAAVRARRDGDKAAGLVSELLKRAAADNRAALDKLAR